MTAAAALVFIAAEPREFKGFLPRLSHIRRVNLPVHWARRANWKDQSIVLAANGAGPDRSSAAAKVFDKPAAIISVGFCGALDPALRIGDIIVADKVFFINQMLECLEITASRGYRRGVIFSSPRIAATREEKQRLKQCSGAVVVEMEAGGIGQVASDRSADFYCIKTVTDLADESFANDFDAALRPDGRYGTGRILGSALLQPRRRLTELIRLKRRCDVAAEKLGEFLDSCSF